MEDNRYYFYVNSRNEFKVILEEDGAAMNLGSVTKVEITYNGTTYDSTTSPTAFDYATGTTGEIAFYLGKIITTLPTNPRDKLCEVAVYESGEELPLYWGKIDVTAEEAA